MCYRVIKLGDGNVGIVGRGDIWEKNVFNGGDD